MTMALVGLHMHHEFGTFAHASHDAEIWKISAAPIADLT
jgi:hypothetical protein